MIEKLKTLIPAAVTPLKKDGSFDEKSTEKLIKHFVKNGVTTNFILGYCGEGRAFTRPERKRVIEFVRKSSPKDMTIVAGCMGESTHMVLEYIEDAKVAGADVALVTPTDFFFLTDEELENLFVELDEKTPLPIMIYNCPENHHYVGPEIMARLTKKKNIIALKESTMTDKIQALQWAIDPADEFVIVAGDEGAYYPAMTIGVDAFIMGGPGNITPKWCFSIWEDYKAGNREKALSEYRKFIAFYMELYKGFPYPMAIPQIKAVMEIAGICERWTHSPVKSVTNEDMRKLEKLLAKYDVKL